ncbi:MAG: TetR/AcrR family transcriptional regulator [Verrucomicrobiales bacterium]|nr:TetR/AcrR family transcriptional regulator [Verrucomicrobiales bacterium]
MKKRVRDPEQTQRKLVAAAIVLILRQGFHATSVDQICAEAGVTKGSFFHHFANKEALGLAAIAAWAKIGRDAYAPAWHDAVSDPLKRLHRMLEIMSQLTERPEGPCVCIVGMMSQEMALQDETLRDACSGELLDWNQEVAAMLAAAKEKHPPAIDFDPVEVAWFLNSLWQGSMLVGKTRAEPALIRRNLTHARAYLDHLFGTQGRASRKPKSPSRSKS